MSIFLAVTPQSVCNGAVKIEPLKQLEIDLLKCCQWQWLLKLWLSTQNRSQPPFPFFFFFCWLVSTQQLQPKSHLGPKQRETLKYSLYIIWMSLRTVSEPCKCVSGRKYKEKERECHIMSVSCGPDRHRAFTVGNISQRWHTAGRLVVIQLLNRPFCLDRNN